MLPAHVAGIRARGFGAVKKKGVPSGAAPFFPD